MELQIVPVAFADIREALQQHLAAQPSRIDSFLEDHICASQHYRTIIAGESAGFTSIHNESLITQFALDDRFKQHGQAVFQRVRKLAQVQSAFVPTSDEFFLTHALDDYRQLAKQAYFFRLGHLAADQAGAHSLSLRLATAADSAFIEQQSGDFFKPAARYIEAQELFLVEGRDGCVGFGLIDRSALYSDVGSIGMYIIERFRRGGMGAATIVLLIEECRRQGLHPVAGCWYYNHTSKKTLERAGMISQTRLLKIDY